jgi:recombination DNA repair RAD52 pathway protein
MSVSFPKQAKDLITAPLRSELIKSRPGGGGKSLSYISGNTVIDILNRAFGYLWSSEIVKVWKEDSVDKVWKENATPQGPVAHAIVRLTIWLKDDNGTMFPIVKEGAGSKEINGGQSDQSEVFKSAATDALKKAATLFGIGLELYRDDDEQAFFNELDYEDPWTDEAKEQFAEQRTFLNDLLSNEDYGLTIEDLDGMVQQFSDGTLSSLSEIVPDNIVSFVAFIQELMNAAGSTEETQE